MSSLDALTRAAPAAATTAAATIPSWGPPIVDLFGLNVPVASTALALAGVFLARSVSSAREGPEPGGHWLTGLLLLLTFAVVVERSPTPGMAVGYGVGIGASGILMFDLLKDFVVSQFKRIFGIKNS